MSWYSEAKETINTVVKNCKDENLKKAIDDAYPFGERRYFPYKAWLKARKEAFIKLNIIPAELTKKQKERQSQLNNEKCLF